MTPEQLASVNAEHSHQRALFAWAQMAERYGFAAAWDEATYTPVGMLALMALKGRPESLATEVPELRWLHAIPNGGYRDAVTAGKLKAEGVKRGVCDVFLPLPMIRHSSGGLMNAAERLLAYAGLYVELKRPRVEKEGKRKANVIAQREGELSAEQTEFVAYAREVGYAVSVCFDWRSAASDIQKYIEAVRNNR